MLENRATESRRLPRCCWRRSSPSAHVDSGHRVQSHEPYRVACSGTGRLARAERGSCRNREAGGNGGWLVLDHSYQDAAFYAISDAARVAGRASCPRRKDRGRSEGNYVSLTEGDVASYRVTLGPDGGNSTARRCSPPTGAPGSWHRESGRRGRSWRSWWRRCARPPREPLPVVNCPSSSQGGLHPGEWNEVEAFIDVNSVRAFLNDTNEATTGAAYDEDGRYGPIALYVGVPAKCASRTFSTRIWPSVMLRGARFEPVPDAAPE